MYSNIVILFEGHISIKRMCKFFILKCRYDLRQNTKKLTSFAKYNCVKQQIVFEIIHTQPLF